MKCLICQSEPARYRCRHCKSAYCRSDCFKTHRQWNTEHDDAVAAGQARETLPEPPLFSCEYVLRASEATRVSGSTKDGCSDTPAGEATSPATTEAQAKVPQQEDDAQTNTDLFRDAVSDGIKQRRLETQAADATSTSTVRNTRTFEEEEEPGQLCMLREKHLSALANNASLRNALKTRELQIMIRSIDKSRSRLEALHTALFNNPEFAQFCATVKSTIASAERRATP